MLLIAKHLLLYASEVKRAGVDILQARSDLVKKFRGGLPVAHYGSVPYILAASQSGTELQFHAINREGQVTLSSLCLLS